MNKIDLYINAFFQAIVWSLNKKGIHITYIRLVNAALFLGVALNLIVSEYSQSGGSDLILVFGVIMTMFATIDFIVHINPALMTFCYHSEPGENYWRNMSFYKKRMAQVDLYRPLSPVFVLLIMLTSPHYHSLFIIMFVIMMHVDTCRQFDGVN